MRKMIELLVYLELLHMTCSVSKIKHVGGHFHSFNKSAQIQQCRLELVIFIYRYIFLYPGTALLHNLYVYFLQSSLRWNSLAGAALAKKDNYLYLTFIFWVYKMFSYKCQ